jgi:sulfonate transport system substrate-binding protein
MSNPFNDHSGANDTRRLLLKAGVASALAAAFGSGAARADESKVLRVGYQKYGNFVVLKAQKTLEKRLASAGYTVQWLEFPGGPQLLEGLNAGAVDVGTVRIGESCCTTMASARGAGGSLPI